MRVRVKICGLTRPEDVAAAADAGADAVGFVLAPSSRRLDLARARELAAAVPPFVARVGVFVDPTEAELQVALDQLGLDLLQLHGHEPPELCRRFGRRVLKAVRVRSPDDLALLERYAEWPILLDSPEPGSGSAFDWTWAAGLGDRRRLVLAGGLTPANVARAVQAVRPWAVDVSTGVEKAPGVKDAGLIQQFVEAVRRTEADLPARQA